MIPGKIISWMLILSMMCVLTHAADMEVEGSITVRGNANFSAEDLPANIANYFCNFDSITGVLVKKSGTGTGNYVDVQNSSGNSQFLIKNYTNGSYTYPAYYSSVIGIGTSSNLYAKMTIMKPYTISGDPAGANQNSYGVSKHDVNLLLTTDSDRTMDRGGSLGFSDTSGFLLGAIKGAATNSTVSPTRECGGYLGFYTTGYNSGGPYEKMRITQEGYVGVGTSSPAQKLDVNGMIQLRGQNLTSTPSTSTNNGLIYANYNGTFDPPGNGSGAGIYAAFGTTHNRLTSHADPRSIDPAARTSFADPSVELPFSFCHWDTVIGKCQIVDMSKMVAWAEKKMKSELGDEAGRLTYTKNLPADKRLAIDQYQKLQSEQQANLVLAKLENMPLIKVALGPGGDVPREAVEEVDEMRSVERRVMIKEKRMDFEKMQVVEVEHESNITQNVATGRKIRRFKSGWELKDGELYRSAKLSDINLDDVVKDTPQLPQWIMDRIKVGQQVSMDVNTLTQQIRQIIASKNSGEQSHQTAQLTQK